ncbi:unnamed protein product [Effrenium voratum]|uniref:Uncharacterized protein n=1 Tax=Effrenium voratum TaxID=2562239 RepID=A0AA36IZT9_9DINO|nr:unnamed protein product [Effrenium voratum]CAJ1460914.1 unnamed protein product [Effrenium voratum]
MAVRVFRYVDSPTPMADTRELHFFYGEADKLQTGTKSRFAATLSRRLANTAPEPVKVTVVGPGAGIAANAEAWMNLKQDPRLTLSSFGQSRMPYDRYPLGWPNGAPGPNLETFAEELLAAGVVEQTECFILGSRGGQIVLPYLWEMKGDAVPPAVVINGGPALDMPRPAKWPSSAVTLLIMGGQDYFRNPNVPPAKWISNARKRVPANNKHTALLYLPEMGHMPPPQVLQCVICDAVLALGMWRSNPSQCLRIFQAILQKLHKSGIAASFSYTSAKGWAEISSEEPLSPRLEPRRHAVSLRLPRELSPRGVPSLSSVSTSAGSSPISASVSPVFFPPSRTPIMVPSGSMILPTGNGLMRPVTVR